MAQKFFHKSDPAIKLILSNGTPWNNWTVIDHENGVIAPHNPYLLENLVRCVQQGHSGVTEISQEKYEDWLKKKPSVLPRRWRDEWAPKAALPSTDGQPTNQSTSPNPSGQDAPAAGNTSLRPSAVKE